ncbi:hypothetical protein L7F22_030499 [Adiantum nelumboides]|nr:hypothetical protein [Adiantum nelumboides]
MRQAASSGLDRARHGSDPTTRLVFFGCSWACPSPRASVSASASASPPRLLHSARAHHSRRDGDGEEKLEEQLRTQQSDSSYAAWRADMAPSPAALTHQVPPLSSLCFSLSRPFF